MTFAYTRKTISADFFSNSFRISCSIRVPVGGLHALLIDPLNSYLELENAYVSRINTPGEIVANHELAAIRKENVLFILFARREDGDPPKGAGSFLKPLPRPAFLTIPSFELRGLVETEAKASPREILVQTSGRYLPLYGATATVAIKPAITFGGSLILVNKEHVESLCMAEA